MRSNRRRFLLAAPLAFALLSACAEQSGSVPDVPIADLTAEVPELDAVHEIMRPLWHDAFPAQDFMAIQEMVPQFEPLLAALDEAPLPGILRDEQAAWDAGKARLSESFAGLKSAAETGAEAEMLAYAEAFHGNYEGLVRIIRPLVPELDTFHQHLYGLYHHYGPGYDLEKIERSATDLFASVPALTDVQLPERLSEHQARFESAVRVLGESVDALLTSLEDPKRAEIEAAIENVHTTYTEAEGIFDEGGHG
jgi:hypothetical protein